jgi:NitT/TauT family transport system substrate-binding protein
MQSITRRAAITLLVGASSRLCRPGFAQDGLAHVIVAQPSEGFPFLPIYVARHRNFFKEEGIDAEVVIFQKGNAEAMSAVLGGQADVFVGLPGLALRAREKGQPIRSFAALQTQFGSEIVISRQALTNAGIRADSPPLDKARALKGLTIAVAGAGGVTDQLVRHVAKFGGLNPDRDLTIVPVGASNMLAAFGQKRVDGFSLSPPTTTAGATRLDGEVLFNFSRGEYPPLANFLFTTLSASDRWLTDSRPIAERFVRAIWRGQRLMKDAPNDARESVRSFFEKFKREEFDAAWSAALPAFPDNPRIDPAGMQQNLDFIRYLEDKTFNVSIGDCFTNSIVDLASPIFR